MGAKSSLILEGIGEVGDQHAGDHGGQEARQQHSGVLGEIIELLAHENAERDHENRGEQALDLGDLLASVSSFGGGGMKVRSVGAAFAAVQLVTLDDPPRDRSGHERAGDHGQRRRTNRHDLGMDQPLRLQLLRPGHGRAGSADEGK